MAEICEDGCAKKINRGFAVSDVQIIPQIEKVNYMDVNIETRLTRNINMSIPFIASPMDSVINDLLAKKILSIGGIPLIFINKKDSQKGIHMFNDVWGSCDEAIKMGVCIASGKEAVDQIKCILDKISVIAIDSLHYCPYKMLETIEYIKNKYPGIDVISGNVTNLEDARRVVDSGADAIRVGMTDNSINRATELFGCGRKQGSALYECSEIADKYNIPIICDGGIKNVNDMPKAIALGASSIMMGRQFAAIIESAATTIEVNGKKMKYYVGMSRKEIIDETMQVESFPRLIETSGGFDVIVNNWIENLKIVIAKSGQRNIEEMRVKSLLEMC